MARAYLPSLTFFPPLLLLTVIPSIYRYPHYAAPISHLLDQIGRHSIPCLGSESTESAFPRDNPAPPFFPLLPSCPRGSSLSPFRDPGTAAKAAISSVYLTTGFLRLYDMGFNRVKFGDD